MPIKRRRDSPYATIAILHFGKLVRIIFFDAIRRICDDSVNAISRHLGKPLEAIRSDYEGLANYFVDRKSVV